MKLERVADENEMDENEMFVIETIENDYKAQACAP